ncbi:NUDIX domain-containing protein [Bacillus cytotoxicus]|uniref:NUDIX domain-containing protein n=1 Tax=Bacillus cytotoxicus TaxID=580165 RepID=A0ACC6ADZ4_9BACI|nr:NUDIX domain-containing protein [Bacillus cytotoxicus]
MTAIYMLKNENNFLLGNKGGVFSLESYSCPIKKCFRLNGYLYLTIGSFDVLIFDLIEKGCVFVRTNIRTAGVLIHNEHVLLHKMDDFWILPGGAVECNGVDFETTMEALKREYKEGLDVEINIIKLLWVAGGSLINLKHENR